MRLETRDTVKPYQFGRANGAVRTAALLIFTAAGMVPLAGCRDSFMDPSIAGGWNPTPTVMPVLTRISSIEDQSDEFVDVSDPVASDLIPLPQVYRLGPGDGLVVTLYDLIVPNQAEDYEVVVDNRGMIELPQLGRISVANLTTEEATDAIKQAMRPLVNDPLASINPRAQRQTTFNIVGAVETPGPYFIPKADYRLLEAVTSGGRFDESIPEIYVIRLVPLTDETRGAVPVAPGAGPRATSPGSGGASPMSGDDLVNVIDSITGGPGAGQTPAPANNLPENNPATSGQAPAIPLDGGQPAAPAGGVRGGAGGDATGGGAPAPAIPLQGGQPAAPARTATAPQTASDASWVYMNNRWVQVTSRGGDVVMPDGTRAAELITQRVIRVPLKPLLAGRQEYNIIIRPGDVVRVPAAPVGLVYVSGQVARPGPYNLPSTNDLTLLRALDAAGGFSSIAIPEKIEITRMVGQNRQATIMLDGAAIAKQTQPDVFLKPNDRINVGTSFWATPLAVFRNGFRVSYGFGFILDRNIANDLFGPPPVNQFNQ